VQKKKKIKKLKESKRPTIEDLKMHFVRILKKPFTPVVKKSRLKSC